MPQTEQGFVKVRRGTTAQWAATGRLLAEGEPGYDTDLHVLKFGDGVSVWSALTSVTGVDSAALQQAVNTAVDGLVAGAPDALDTLKELADALGNDANFAAHLTAILATKADSAAVTAAFAALQASLPSNYASLDGSSRLAIGGTELTPDQVGAASLAQARGAAAGLALVFGA